MIMNIDKIQTKGYNEDRLASQLRPDTEVTKAEDYGKLQQGDTVIVVENDQGEREGYVANQPVHRSLVGKIDDVVEFGVYQAEGQATGASANHYNDRTADEVAAMLGADVSFGEGEAQRRDESTNVSQKESESKKAGQGFIHRTLEQDRRMNS